MPFIYREMFFIVPWYHGNNIRCMKHVYIVFCRLVDCQSHTAQNSVVQCKRIFLLDCKLVVTCKMQNRNATDKLNQQCSKLALFANTINNVNLLHCGFSLSVALHFASDNQLAILCNNGV